MRAVVRGLVATVVAGVLAAAAGCGGGDGDGGSGNASGQPTPPPTSEVQEDTPDSSASVFLGQGTDESTAGLNVPTAPVGQPASADLTVTNPQGETATVQNVAASTTSGETSVIEDTCTGVALPPGGTCRIRVRHIATEAGSYSGELTATTSDGKVVTVGITGEASEAVGAATPSEEVTPESASPSPTPEETYTDIEPLPTEG
ncbi:hypothetical protein ACF059_16160 [Streptomyces sp. NPDC016562]|uniref:Ig-like domain-containing protein n=1 Tax=Streptomyces sp. NPDC016562 TaxID=3364966 RepID=UPI0036FE00A8